MPTYTPRRRQVKKAEKVDKISTEVKNTVTPTITEYFQTVEWVDLNEKFKTFENIVFKTCYTYWIFINTWNP